MDQLHSLAARYFGVEGEVTPLVSERDQNARIGTGEDSIVLKISNSAEDPSQRAMQHAVLRHLAEAAPDLPVPRLLSPNDDAGTIEHGAVMHEEGSQAYAIRALTWLDGIPLSAQRPDHEGLHLLGGFLGRVSTAFEGFFHPAAARPAFLWNLDNAGACREMADSIADPVYRQLVADAWSDYDLHTRDKLPFLRQAVIHQDANEDNLLVSADGGQEIVGLLDFGDMVFGRQINELAVAMAYALMDQRDIYNASRAIISGYSAAFPVRENELEVLFDLIKMRLVMSVSISSERSRKFPDNEYLLTSQKSAFNLLKHLQSINRDFIHAIFREAAGYAPVAEAPAITKWLASEACQPVSLFAFDLRTEPRIAVPLAPGADGMELKKDPDVWWQWLKKRLVEEGAVFAVGLYGEERDVYSSAAFASDVTSERRSQHLGMDFFVEAGTTVRAPLDGTVFSVVNNDEHLSYGPTVVIQHRAGNDGPVFYTFYGHLSIETLGMVSAGQSVRAGETIATIGNSKVNVGWAPHLHFQIITAPVTDLANFHGVGEPSLWPVWTQISPDPYLICRMADATFALDATPPKTLAARRKQRLGPSLSISYNKKLKIVDGRGAWLIDHSGREYLDCVNNIAHVGHGHPHVVEALSRQAARLNTNTRYLHDTILDFADRLTDKLPDPLEVAYFCCSGSEANELALRIARTATGLKDVIALDWGYHGNTQALIEISPYKFKRQGGFAQPSFVEVAELPDPYRGRHKGYGEDAGLAYAAGVNDAVRAIQLRNGQGPAAFIAESIAGCGGQIVYPKGFLKAAYQSVRASGGICIADEVQCGFGRAGSHFWAFEQHDVVPDIVVLGKPIGNGHPLSAVITTKDLADQFANGMEYFNSFGGNPVSTAVGMAVLDVIEQEQLQANALETGNYVLQRWREMQQNNELIGDVHGTGLFLGMELVEDRGTIKPATEKAGKLVNLLRDDGILLSTDGPLDNVIKFKPPMVFSRSDADLLCDKMERAFTRIPLAV